MSRRRTWAAEPGWCWDYGWDPPMDTYFAQLMPDGREVERPAAWYGTRLREVQGVEELAALMGVELSDEQSAQLEEDRRTDSEEVNLEPPWRAGDPPPAHVRAAEAVREAQQRALIEERESARPIEARLVTRT